jgi:hypothetical protein
MLMIEINCQSMLQPDTLGGTNLAVDWVQTLMALS